MICKTKTIILNQTQDMSKKVAIAVSPLTKTTVIDKQLDVVVCHFEEKLDWLSAVDLSIICRIFVYHKGQPSKTASDYSFPSCIPHQKLVWITLKNVGRESHTIVHHCLHLVESKQTVNTNTLHTLFVQGNIKDHASHVYPVTLWFKYLQSDYVCAQTPEIWKNTADGTVIHHSKWADEKKSGKMQTSKLTLLEFYFFVFRRFYPKHVGLFTTFHNCFSVANSRIMSHHKNMYKRLLQILQTHANPEEGHYFERICCSLFGGRDTNMNEKMAEKMNVNASVSNVVNPNVTAITANATNAATNDTHTQTFLQANAAINATHTQTFLPANATNAAINDTHIQTFLPVSF